MGVQLSGNDAESSSPQSESTTASDTSTERRSDDDPSRNGKREKLSGSKPKSKRGSQKQQTAGAQGQNEGAGQAAAPKPEPDPEPTGKKFATTELNVRTGPGESYDVLTTVDEGSKLTITDNTDGPWAQIIHKDEPRWVTAEYLADKKPKDDENEGNSGDDGNSGNGVSEAPCDSGSDVESGLTPDAILVHRTVCANFPEVSSYGGLRPGDGGEHGSGQALDIMVSGSAGDEIAEFVKANSGKLGVSEVLWEQQIWTVERGSEGWRPMEDRGSETANHFDHVHVTVYGESAG